MLSREIACTIFQVLRVTGPGIKPWSTTYLVICFLDSWRTWNWGYLWVVFLQFQVSCCIRRRQHLQMLLLVQRAVSWNLLGAHSKHRRVPYLTTFLSVKLSKNPDTWQGPAQAGHFPYPMVVAMEGNVRFKGYHRLTWRGFNEEIEFSTNEISEESLQKKRSSFMLLAMILSTNRRERNLTCIVFKMSCFLFKGSCVQSDVVSILRWCLCELQCRLDDSVLASG